MKAAVKTTADIDGAAAEVASCKLQVLRVFEINGNY